MRAAHGLCVFALLVSSVARAEEQAPSERPEGTVLTFYGLRQLEQDPRVSDAEKVREWTAFVERARQQMEYAELAIDRWKDASKLRLVETARLAERNEGYSLRQRIAQWKAVVDAYPDTSEAADAKKRMAFWQAKETSRLVEAAESVEQSGRSKVDRIQAWLSVKQWDEKGRAGKAAGRRIDALQRQLFTEAESVDEIERLDAQTKLDAWRDVLRGAPSAKQRKRAELRVAELERSVGR